MAKLSSVNKYKRNLKMIAQYKERYAKIKEILQSTTASYEEKEAARRKLARIPKTALPVRLHRRCELTGRTRGVYKKFNLVRHKFRELAHKGFLPGVSKASW